MRNDPFMNLRVMRASAQNGQRNAKLLRTANNMNMRIMLRSDPKPNWILRMRRAAEAVNHGNQSKGSGVQIPRTLRGDSSMGLRVMKKSYM